MNYKANAFCDISDHALNAQSHLGEAREDIAVITQHAQQMDLRQNTGYQLLRQALKDTDPRSKDAKVKAALHSFASAEKEEADQEKGFGSVGRKVTAAHTSIGGILDISERERSRQPAIA